MTFASDDEDDDGDLYAYILCDHNDLGKRG